MSTSGSCASLGPEDAVADVRTWRAAPAPGSSTRRRQNSAAHNGAQGALHIRILARTTHHVRRHRGTESRRNSSPEMHRLCALCASVALYVTIPRLGRMIGRQHDVFGCEGHRSRAGRRRRPREADGAGPRGRRAPARRRGSGAALRARFRDRRTSLPTILPGPVDRARERRDAADGPGGRTNGDSAFIRCRPSRARADPNSSTARGRAVTAEHDAARERAHWLAGRLGLRPFDIRDESRVAVSRRRRDGVELPRHALSRGRASARERRRAAGGAAAADAAYHRQRLRADRPHRPRRRGDRRRAPRRDPSGRAGSRSPLPGDGAGDTRRDDGSHGRRAPPRPRAAPQSRRQSPSCRRWARCTAGHVALFETARRSADVVVASIFVNPSQFGDPADLAALSAHGGAGRAPGRIRGRRFLLRSRRRRAVPRGIRDVGPGRRPGARISKARIAPAIFAGSRPSARNSSTSSRRTSRSSGRRTRSRSP